MSTLAKVTEQAPAKLNLALSVGPRRPDGMHPVCSWMVTLDLVDELTVVRLEPDRLSRFAIQWHRQARRRSAIDWPIRRDLAVRAHLALEAHVGRSLPVQMTLHKRIPVGGGLGGGSSDAAAMLRAVNRLFELGLEPEDLAGLAAELGSDVPFLVRGGSAIVSGTGASIAPHPRPPSVHVVLVMPEARCPTAQVYAAFDEAGPAALREADVDRMAAAAIGPHSPFNDLTAAAMRVAPALARVRDDVAALAERPAHLSGSGSTLFVLCDDPPHAEAVAALVQQRLKLPAVAARTWPVHEAIAV
jgi:4-diphosphocytidyl-2-C-methyl-D-erythritol kinase